MNKGNILLIHGTWCNGGNWGEFASEFERRGYKIYAPTNRYHGKAEDIDIWGSAQKVSKVGLLDYVSDLVELVDEMDSPPIVMGHSVGALLAQLVAGFACTSTDSWDVQFLSICGLAMGALYVAMVDGAPNVSSLLGCMAETDC